MDTVIGSNHNDIILAPSSSNWALNSSVILKIIGGDRFFQDEREISKLEGRSLFEVDRAIMTEIN